MAFATSEHVATRLGRDLTAAEQELVEQVIGDVAGLIAAAVGKTEAWAAALDPVPVYFRALCIEKAISIGSNPANLAAQTKQIGSYSIGETFRRSDAAAIFLTPGEERAVRRAYYGASSASARIGSIADDVLDYADDGLLNDSLGS